MKHKLIRLTGLVSILLFIPSLYGQKSAPIAGDAAQLIDFLRKDYNSVPWDKRPEEVARDRAKVLAIFKGYLTDDERETLKVDEVAKIGRDLGADEHCGCKDGELSLFDGSKSKDNTVDLATATREYNYALELRKRLNPSGLRSQSIDNLDTILNETKCLEQCIEIKRKTYLDLLYKIDTNQLVSFKDADIPNPYLNHMADKFKAKYKALQSSNTDIQAQAAYQSSIQKALPFFGGDLGFSTVIEGLGRFIAKRLKEELNVFVIGQFQEWLRQSGPNDPLAELKIMLPKTLGYLLSFDADQLTSFPDEIKQFIEDDFNNLLANAANLKESPRFKKLVAAYPETAFAFEALEFIPQLSEMSRPIEYFGLIEHSETISEWAGDHSKPKTFNLANSLKLSSLLAHSLTVVKDGQLRFAGLDFLGNYAEEPEFFLLYMALLLQQDKKYFQLEFTKNGQTAEVQERLKAFMEKGGTKPTEIKATSKQVKQLAQILTQIGKSSTEVYEQGTAIRKARKRGEKIGADTVYQFIDATIDLAEKIAQKGDGFLKLLDPALELNLEEKTAPYFATAHLSNEIVLDFQQKKFAGGLLKALELPAKLIPNEAEVLTDLQNVIVGMERLQTDQLLEDWRLVLKKVKSEKNMKGEKVKTAAKRILTSLPGIRAFLQKQNPALDLTRVDALKDKLTLIANGNNCDWNSLQGTLKQLRPQLLSYFLGTPIDGFVDRLVTAVNGLSAKGDVIDSGQKGKLSGYFKTYTEVSFDVIFFGENPKEKFKRAKLELQTFVLANLNNLPQRFNLRLHPNVLKLVHFLNEMATAEDSEDVAEAIEAIALPSGSFAIKRKSKFNLALGTYPGFLMGGQTSWNYPTTGNDSTTTYSTKNAFAPSFTAPVGLSMAWGGKKRGWSKGVYISVLDIGAVTRLYLDSDSTTQTIPELTWRNVFAPGVYFTLGIPKTPLSINLGIQYGPELQLIDKDPLESMRYGAGLTVDIPLLNLFTKPRMEGL